MTDNANDPFNRALRALAARTECNTERGGANGATTTIRGRVSKPVSMPRLCWRHFVGLLRFRGPAFTIPWCAAFAVRQHGTDWFIGYKERRLDRKYGIDTAGHIALTTLHPDLSRIEPCHPHHAPTPSTKENPML
jgi:hypothetical protein